MRSLPNQDELGQDPPVRICEETLGRLRSLREDLLPGPDEVVDGPAGSWISYAESVFFSCFESVESAQPVTAAYRRLEGWQAEVEAGLRSLEGA